MAVIFRSGIFAFLILLACQAAAVAGPAGNPLAASLPPGTQCFRDLSYGSDSLQRFDVYAPPGAKDSPVIFMVHGGLWRFGDKAAQPVLENKVARWVPRGFVFISANYRLLPDADPLRQADDVARALAAAQAKAASWGGDPSKFILMGHSAGAHLIGMLAAEPSRAIKAGAKPWLGTVLLDSAVLDLENIMSGRHYRFYDRIFGDQPAYWRSVSPRSLLSGPTAPIMAVCSTRHMDSCGQAKAFLDKAASFGTRVKLLKVDLSHREVNSNLGLSGAYTDAVEDFMDSLDASVKNRLAVPPTVTR